MHITVLGAAGRTGRHLVRLAIGAGYSVTAVVRDTGTYGPPAAGVEVAPRGQ